MGNHFGSLVDGASILTLKDQQVQHKEDLILFKMPSFYDKMRKVLRS